MDLSKADAALQAYYTLPPGEALAMKTVVAGIDQKIQDVDSELHRLQDTVAKLTQERSLFLEQRDKYYSSMSLLRTLPTENVQQIFQFSISSDIKMRTTICLVCRFWRDAAMRAPSLWTTIQVFEKKESKETPSVESINTLLSRSGSLLLTLRFDSDWGYRPKPTVAFPLEHLFKSVDPSRWLSISLKLPHEHSLPFPRKKKNTWTNLKTLSLSTQQHDLRNQNFPALGHLDLQGLLERTSFQINFPWSTLTSLKLDFAMKLEAFLNILPSCALLHQIVITVNAGRSFDSSSESDNSDAVASPSQPVMLKNLQELSISANRFPDGLLPRMKTPVLRRFTCRVFEDYLDYGLDDEGQLLPFLGQVANTLEALHIDYEDPDDQSLHDCLKNMPNLAELRLHSLSDQTAEFLTFLTLTPSCRNVPNLEKLEIMMPNQEHMDIDGDPGTEELFIALVQSRWWNDAVLHSPEHSDDESDVRSFCRRLKYAAFRSLEGSEFQWIERLENLKKQCEALKERLRRIDPTPIQRKLANYQGARKNMEAELRGHWVGPMPYDGFMAKLISTDDLAPVGLVNNYCDTIPTGPENTMYRPFVRRIKNAPWRAGRPVLIPRAHNRFLENFIGKRLAEFANPKEFLIVVMHAIEAHHDALYLCGFLHRDISDNNIMITDANRGILNDWDMAKRVGIPGQKPPDPILGARHSHRTGTWYFMSGALLGDSTKLHTLQDDLESFFHVVLYYALQYLPHDKPQIHVRQSIVKIFKQCEYNAFLGHYLGGGGKREMIQVQEHLDVLILTDNAPLTTWIRSALKALRLFYTYVLLVKQEYLDKNPEPRNIPTIFPLDTDKLANHDYFLELCATALASPDAAWPDNRKTEMLVPQLPIKTTKQVPVLKRLAENEPAGYDLPAPKKCRSTGSGRPPKKNTRSLTSELLD